ncbi:hypothetical protein JZ751_008875 [Albula glossodonta]|uniref:Sushi domain-containing protein n=1 Tax=Albula glossodonta TaxID=121402 RepID=A0A8T2P323_9TELE|nr:hypothetical protein JZ751_008875 [Albula glossodonta]
MNERLSMTSRCSRLLVLLVSLSLSLNQDIVSANEECPPPPQREKTKPFNRTLSYPEGHMFVYACIDGYVRKVGTSAYTWCMKEKERTPQWDNIDGPLALVCIPDPKIKKTTKGKQYLKLFLSPPRHPTSSCLALHNWVSWTSHSVVSLLTSTWLASSLSILTAPVAIQTTPSWRKALPTRLVKPRPTVPATTKADSRTTKITKIRLITTRTTEMESRRVTPPVTTSNTFRSHTTTKTSTSTSSGKMVANEIRNTTVPAGVVSGIMVIFLIAVGVGGVVILHRQCLRKQRSKYLPPAMESSPLHPLQTHQPQDQEQYEHCALHDQHTQTEGP